jgi:hypothetical protein
LHWTRGARRTMLACRVLLSGNVPSNVGGGTNETRIIAADLCDSFLWEDSKAPITSAPSS